MLSVETPYRDIVKLRAMANRPTYSVQRHPAITSTPYGVATRQSGRGRAPTYKKQRLLIPPFICQVLFSSLLSPLNILYDIKPFPSFLYNYGNIKLTSTAGCFLPTSHYRRKNHHSLR